MTHWHYCVHLYNSISISRYVINTSMWPQWWVTGRGPPMPHCHMSCFQFIIMLVSLFLFYSVLAVFVPAQSACSLESRCGDWRPEIWLFVNMGRSVLSAATRHPAGEGGRYRWISWYLVSGVSITGQLLSYARDFLFTSQKYLSYKYLHISARATF